ncbi:hypothetical protein R0290_07910 [Burkholderia semiarida]|uniref:hypothetical protein n=1 Tax=Burkholderia semiarida TaxID=2843303 RepID=UPI0034589DEF
MARFVVDNALRADDIDAQRAGIRRRDLSPTMTEAASRTALLREWGNCRFRMPRRGSAGRSCFSVGVGTCIDRRLARSTGSKTSAEASIVTAPPLPPPGASNGKVSVVRVARHP